MIPMTKVCGAAFLPIRASYANMIRGKKEVKRLEKEIEEGLARKSKINISG